ncbi:MAG: restriction endonuclease subunit S [Lachnospiraceae bacterium]|jgi:type I restriction enzyme S subunit|nr:restriction endonuclease subunit S [Lachnospiraceae bacterium]MCI1657656.1 restriction endonuclease subunit S [Lachnospiraceae bacterium]MCI2196072.1 restriction endonuclease subunit S [Lachnospiraceae bacterium]
MKISFDDVFEDRTKYGTKVKTDEYHTSGAHIIIDQGQEQVAGYTDREEGVFSDIPAIVFGDHTRVIKYVDKPFFLGADGVKVLRCKYKGADYKYLYYALKSARIPNTGYNRHFKWLKETRIPYPDLTRQSEIVHVLDDVSSIITKRQQELAILDELIKARFVEMFGDPEINTKGYQKEPLQKHADVLVGYPFKSEGYTEGGVRIVGGYNLMQGFIIWEDCKYWPDTDGFEQYLLKDGDIVMAMDRPWVNGGFKIASVDKEHLPALLIQRTACIRGKDVEQEFLYSLLNSHWFADHCNITGSLVPHISNKDINSYEIVLPPIEEQKAYAEFVRQVDKSKVAVLTAA